jgi:hypothetical protein
MPLDSTGVDTSFDALEKMDRVIDLLAHEDHWGTQLLRCYGGRYCMRRGSSSASTIPLTPTLQLKAF